MIRQGFMDGNKISPTDIYLTIVVDKGGIVYGGQDITDDVMKGITGK